MRSWRPNLSDLESMLGHIPKQMNYNDWLAVALDLINFIGKESAIKLISNWSPSLNQHGKENTAQWVSSVKEDFVEFPKVVFKRAKENGFTPTNAVSTPVFRAKTYENMYKPKSVIVDDAKIVLKQTELNYKVGDDFPEFVNDLINDEMNQGKSYFQAKKDITGSSDFLKKERCYKITSTPNVKNKANTGAIHKNLKCYNFTLKELALYVGAGYGFYTCMVKDKSKSVSYDNFKQSELIAIDFDGGITIDEVMNDPYTKEYAEMLYTTKSHTVENNRFRLIIPLPTIIDELELYKILLKYFLQKYPISDRSTTAVKFWSGNNNTEIILLKTSEILTFKNGILQNEN